MEIPAGVLLASLLPRESTEDLLTVSIAGWAPPRGTHTSLLTFRRLDDCGDGEGCGRDAGPVHPGEPAARLPHLLRDARLHGGHCRLSSRVSLQSLFSPGPPHKGLFQLLGPITVVFEAVGKGERSQAASHRGLASTVE